MQLFVYSIALSANHTKLIMYPTNGQLTECQVFQTTAHKRIAVRKLPAPFLLRARLQVGTHSVALAHDSTPWLILVAKTFSLSASLNNTERVFRLL